MSPKVEKLIQERAAYRAVITKQSRSLEEFLQDSSITQLKAKLQHIKSVASKLVQYNADVIATITGEEDLADEVEKACEYDEKNYLIISEIEAHISAKTPTKHNADKSKSLKDLNLPKLALPRFSGKLTEWLAFWDIFKSTIHQADIDNVRKFYYLRGQLDGPAKQLIEGFTIDDASYLQAVDLLEHSFGNKEQLKIAHVTALIELQAPGFNINDLTRFRAEIECHTRSLKTLGTTMEEFMVIIMRQKLPLAVLDKVRSFDLGIFKQELGAEINNLQLSTTGSADLKTNPDKSTQGAMGTMAMVVGHKGKQVNRAGQYRCKLCDQYHKWFKCSKYQTPGQKINRAKALNLCTSCMSKEHHTRCTASYLRPCRRCEGHHFFQLCTVKTDDVVKPENSTTTLAVKSNGTVSLPTVRIPFNGPYGTVVCRALLDQCSQRTFIKRDTLQKLEYNVVRTDELRLVGFVSTTEKTKYQIVEVSYQHKQRMRTLQCVVVEELPDHKMQGLEGVERSLRRKNIHISDPMGDAEIDLLIGADQYYDIVHPGFRKVNNVHLIPTIFGYTLSGHINATSSQVQIDTVSILKVGSTVTESMIRDDMINDLTCPVDVSLEKFWALDHVGIKADEVDLCSKVAMKQFEESITWCNDDRQYQVKLPWKVSNRELPSNYGLAKGRLNSLRDKLLKQPKLLRAYDNIFKEYKDRKFIELVDDRAIRKPVHYLAHHGVHKESPTTPIRVVFDCSARVGKGPGLNDCLLTGPSLVADLSQQLLRFRLGRYACLSDIEKAFLMVKLHPEDRDVTRFLWFLDPFDLDSEMVTYRFAVVLFGATCSQFLLNATIKHHLENCEEDTESLARGLYIDNFQGSKDTEVELIEIYEQACRLFQEAHLYLREWVSNGPLLQQRFNTDGRGASESNQTRVLGMLWDTSDDTLRYVKRKYTQEVAYTKRTFLSRVAQFFDPLGLTLPVTIRARILMQNIWRCNLGWDDSLPDDLQQSGRDLLMEYDTLDSTMQVSRYIAPYNSVSSLHGFCDASNTAYGAAIYMTCPLGVNLVTARAKVAPIKKLTIPKMELTSLLLLGRLIHHVCEIYGNELDIREIHIWSDSQVTLNWVHSQRTLPVYVRNRVDEIKTLLPNARFHYVRSKENPSDLLTRGLTAKQLLKSELWWHGPEWLQHQTEWPMWMPTEEDKGISALAAQSESDELPESKFPWDRFSSYDNLIAVVGWIQRFVNNVRSRDNKLRGQLTAEEYKSAEVSIMKMVQHESYASELTCLKSSVMSKNCLIRQLNLFLKDGVIKCEGRLKWSHLEDDTKQPILMPNKHTVTDLLIRRVHADVKHYGVNHTVSQLRLNWWIPRIRQVVKRIIRKCVICLKLKGRPCSTGAAPNLPDTRVQSSEPFAIIGVDYTGALRVKEGTKVYILLFTCAVTRAIHLELCDSMTSEDFMLAFRRFCSRRSFPKIIYSDNAPSFHQSANYLNALKDDPQIARYLGTHNCVWRFIPVEAPWMGGIWERCVGTVKGGLRAVIGRALLKRVELNTIMSEVEAVVNDRPITYVYNDSNEPLPLTPSHLLYGRPIISFPTDLSSIREIEDPSMYDKQSITRRYQYISKLIEDFRRRWSHDYLLALRERYAKRTYQPSMLRVGDVVLIHGDGPRLYWKLGRILEIYSGKDTNGRVALVKTVNGNTVRPIARLYRLEIDDSTLVNDAGPGIDEGEKLTPVLDWSESSDAPDSSQAGIAGSGIAKDYLNNEKHIDDNADRIGIAGPVGDTEATNQSDSQVGIRVRRTAADARRLWRQKLASGQL